eukprot:2603591-Prymnesium_polylepis.1
MGRGCEFSCGCMLYRRHAHIIRWLIGMESSRPRVGPGGGRGANCHTVLAARNGDDIADVTSNAVVK